jgi:hypothetical protein
MKKICFETYVVKILMQILNICYDQDSLRNWMDFVICYLQLNSM